MDPQSFLSQKVNAALSTKRIAVPAGEYPARVSKVDYRQMPNKQKPGEHFHIYEVTFAIDDENAKAVTGLNEPTVRKSIFLELGPDGLLDTSKGKNVDLGRFREAIGQNDPDKEWGFEDPVGAVCVIQVVNEPSADGQDTYANVGKMGKLG